MGFTFEWDEEKAKVNIRKHRVSFYEAVTVFNDSNIATLDDSEHSDNEERYVCQYRIFVSRTFVTDN